VSVARILVVDDEAGAREAVVALLGRWGYQAEGLAEGQAALARAAETRPDLVLSDLSMPGVDGLMLLRNLRGLHPDAPVILLTGRGTIPLAVDALRDGAWDFIEKPVEPLRLKRAVERALERPSAQREVLGLRRRLKQLGQGDFIGQSVAMRRLFELMQRVAASRASVAILGESGTGKEVVARTLHQLSPRQPRPFVAINCASIPATLIESELFGHERGAFTGADQRRAGVFELAHGGTLFLDEVGEIPVELQAKLLRVLEEGRLRRLGGRSETEVDVRVLCATNRDLKAELRAQRFREDLYFRLNVFQLQLPPLRDRREDIPLLVQHFVEKFARDSGRPVAGVQPSAMGLLRAHDWPGNIRELRNAVERAVILCDGEYLLPEHFPPELQAGTAPHPLFQVPWGLTLDVVEKAYIQGSLARLGNNKARTAEGLGVSEKTLYNKLHRYAAEARAGGAEGAGSGAAVAPDGP
jgi:DNA-binding NtrC family response regulator